MEEILASIRNIIADEREPAETSAAKPASPGPGLAPAPQIVYSNEAQAPRRPGLSQRSLSLRDVLSCDSVIEVAKDAVKR